MKHLNVVAAVIVKNGAVFAAQRANKGELALCWEFPGGKVEQGETAEEALIREIKEELGAKIKVLKFLKRVNHNYKSFSITLDAYLCDIEEGTLKLSEHVDSKWLIKEDLYDVNWAAADLPVVKIVGKLLNGHYKTTI